MKFHYYPETDSLYIDFVDKPGVEAREIERVNGRLEVYQKWARKVYHPSIPVRIKQSPPFGPIFVKAPSCNANKPAICARVDT